MEVISNVTDLLVQRGNDAPNHIAFERREREAPLDEPWTQVTTREFMNEVMALAKGIIASGIDAGDTVVIMAPTQYLWAVADQAALFAGAVVVPVYDTATVQQLSVIVADAQPKLAFVGAETHRERLTRAMTAAGLEQDPSAPNQVWVMDDRSEHSLQGLIERGTDISDLELQGRREHATLDDVATIVYTSGTTGDPKGAVITHRNLVGQVMNTAAAYSEVVKETGNTILFLPLTHVLGRALQLICIANGMRIAHLSDPKEVVQALAILKPTFLVVVPRVLEKIEGAAAAAAREKRVQPLWRAAHRAAVAWGEFLEAADRDHTLRPPLSLRLRRAAFDRIFYQRLRAVMGGRIEYLLSGAATLRPELARFFRGIGVPVIEGYGLTETTAPLTGGRPGSLVAGSVGPPLPGNSVRIAENGEVLAQGVGVFAGYRNPAHNADAFVDGYFRTGDLGWLSTDGSLTLVGRLKHVIVTSTGRTISPEHWEQAVETHPLVAHAVLVGTDRPFLTGLLVVDAEAVTEWFRDRGDAPPAALQQAGITICRDGRLTEQLSAAVDAANAGSQPSERVSTWAAIFVGENQLAEFVTPTMKLKRQALLQQTGEVIEELYASQGHRG
ncbi:AMP-binding protein [Leucobacter viscericola]|uniref:AMP-binding protein n=1 Tax=Leucobacter viscericola TaxID=2714935 RepID=A0A6G7XJK2_9MICO|nr:AMP-binding protein [Leucobacter viscericola]